jgi:hypothetical protein
LEGKDPEAGLKQLEMADGIEGEVAKSTETAARPGSFYLDEQRPAKNGPWIKPEYGKRRLVKGNGYIENKGKKRRALGRLSRMWTAHFAPSWQTARRMSVGRGQRQGWRANLHTSEDRNGLLGTLDSLPAVIGPFCWMI